MAQALFTNILRIALISSIGICIILLLKKTLFKKYTQSFNYYIWLIVIIRMILPFKIPIYLNQNLMINKLSTFSSLNTDKAISEASNNGISLNSSSNTNQIIDATKHFNINTFEILSYLWLIITLIIIIYRIFSYLKLKRTILDLSINVQDEKTNYIYNDLLNETTIKKNIILKISDYTSVPFGIGIFKSYIILPKIDYEESEVIWILRHELMHYKKKDLIYKLLVMVVTSIYWFNPLIYVMNKYINIECELSCDEKILHKCDFNERKNYALTLLNSLKQSQSNLNYTKLATELGNKEILKRRFDNMLNRKTKRGIFLGAIAIIIGICSLGAVSTKAAPNVLKETQESIDTSSDKNVIEQYSIATSSYKGYYLIIKDPTRVKIAYSSKLMTEEETTSEIAKNNNAVAAINGISFGDFYPEVKLFGGKTRTGIVLSNGQVIYNGLKDDQKSDLFAINKLGQLIVGSYSLNDLTHLDAQEALTGFPSLVINGEKTQIQGDGGLGATPRTAIGQRKDGAIIMLAIDGNFDESSSLGATIKEEQEIIYELGAVNAINLGGGKSTTMYYTDEVINKPSDENREKKVPTTVIVK
ncbi:peptidase M56 BlaR1 [Clostridium sp. DL-VIII]|uniref:M56 and phosphodiester glycosidase domain-containing protein n=1 Tax=Clostridium sp. DL-VIII TaxID=641107 RepID=UPI00023AFC43|nr:M56 and phosphodiester glycosidase domain-containing protein [Clostridium sp. DL-VIII]EHI99517.1 peptidase M56 BlaR1 [Clostridium sp. DL-VIII]